MKIPFTSYELLKNGELETVRQSYSEVNKKLESLETTAKIKPVLDFLETENMLLPHASAYASDLSFKDMQELARLSSVYRQSVMALLSEIFRRGGEFKPKFTRKCTNESCGKEFEAKVTECDDCHSVTKEPEILNLTTAKEFFKKCNENGDSVLDVLQRIEWDFDTVDRGYGCLSKEYIFDNNGEIKLATLKEFFRINPSHIVPLLNNKGELGYTQEGKQVFVCPIHRNAIKNNEGNCYCGKKLYRAYFKTFSSKEEIYYMRNEIIYATKFDKSILGYPPFLTVYQKVMIELNMDWYIKKGYEKGRPPSTYLFVKTSNIPSLQKMIDWVAERVKLNPHSVVPIGVDTQSNGNFVQSVNLMTSMAEMQATEFRNIIKREIGALLGVMPIFQGDLSTSGGLNNEGLQVTVTNRATESGQAIYNNKFFPEILSQLGIKDYVFELLPSEEKDEMAELQRKQLEIQNAQLMKSMGFEVKYNEDGKFEFSNEVKAPPVNNSLLPGSSLFGNSTEQRFSGEPEFPVAKSLAKPVKNLLATAGNVEKTLEEELAEMIGKLNFSRKPGKAQMQKVISGVVSKFGLNLRKATSSEIKKAYLAAVEEIEKELNMNFVFGGVDKNAIDVLSNSQSLTQAYSGMEAGVSQKVNEVIEKAFENPEFFTIDKIVTEMKQVSNDEEYKLRNIARTETSKVTNVARMNSYAKADPEGVHVYKWIGPEDSRTTDICKEIKSKTQEGVSLTELKKIIDDSVLKFNPDFKPDGLTPHINCRHTFVRVV